MSTKRAVELNDLNVVKQYIDESVADVKGSAEVAKKVTESIGDVALGEIFETDGKTVIKATHAASADTASTADSAINVTTNIAGNAIKEIFVVETNTDGEGNETETITTRVKAADSATNATYADNATNAGNVTGFIGDKDIFDIFETGGDGKITGVVKVASTANNVPTKTSELTNDGDDGESIYATQDWVNTNAGKINIIKVNGTELVIDGNDKSVNIEIDTVANIGTIESTTDEYDETSHTITDGSLAGVDMNDVFSVGAESSYDAETGETSYTYSLTAKNAESADYANKAGEADKANNADVASKLTGFIEVGTYGEVAVTDIFSLDENYIATSKVNAAVVADSAKMVESITGATIAIEGTEVELDSIFVAATNASGETTGNITSVVKKAKRAEDVTSIAGNAIKEIFVVEKDDEDNETVKTKVKAASKADKADSATNVTTNIAGNTITSIFECETDAEGNQQPTTKVKAASIADKIYILDDGGSSTVYQLKVTDDYTDTGTKGYITFIVEA